MKKRLSALLLAAAILLPAAPADAAGTGITVTVQDGYQCDYGVDIPFTPSPRTSSYTFALYEGNGTSGSPEVSAEVTVSSAGTVHLPLRYDVSGPSTWTLSVTTHVMPGREAFDRESTADETFTTAPVCGCPAGTAGAFYAGDGSERSPYRVGTPQQLQHLNHARHLAAGQHFRQTADLDFSSYGNWDPIGNASAAFTGNYDGDGYLIKNLSQASTQYGGLFGRTNGTNLFCIGIVNPTVNGTEVGGGLVANANDSKLERCFVQGGSAAGYYHCGGLIGYAVRCELQDCYAVGTAISATGASINLNDAAGLIGRTAYSGTISSCFAIPGSLSTSTSLAGYPDCRAGLVGCLDPATVFAASYWATGRGASYACDRQVNSATSWSGGSVDPSGTRGMSADGFASSSNLSGFDFTDTWRMDATLGYPVLRAFDH